MAPLIAVAASVLPGLIEALAGPRAGQVADAVGRATSAVLGTDDPEAAALAIRDPAKAADLRVRLTEIAIEDKRVDLADVANARAQTIALAQSGSGIAWGAPLVTGIVLAALAFVSWFAMTREIPAANQSVAVGLVEALKIMAASCVAYWVGSSAGSKRSGDAVRAIAERSAAPMTADDLNDREARRVRA